MEELLALLERYAPGYSSRIQGASGWALNKLEEVFGHPLPDFYREFARAMGKDGGALLVNVDAYDPFHIADIYQLSSNELPPRRFLFILGDPSPLAPNPYWLDLDAPTEEGDYQVVRFPLIQDSWKKNLSRDYASLRELLFLWAMDSIHLPSFPQQVRYRRGRGQVATADELSRFLEKMGFNRLPYPHYSMLLERNDAAVRLYRPPSDPHFELRVGMHSPEALKQLQALIEDNTDLEKVRW